MASSLLADISLLRSHSEMCGVRTINIASLWDS